ncbi:MAG: hypothetical protein JOY98_11540 [Candidatus Eremiobacteraeota bacterium]|nr:hypothetical protein [Candidatus Eremiobacteraeota bacterium]
MSNVVMRERGWISVIVAGVLGLTGCAGAGQNLGSMVPGGNGAFSGPGGNVPSGATMLRVHVPWAIGGPATPGRGATPPPGAFAMMTPTPLPTIGSSAPGSAAQPVQALSFNVSGPTPANVTIAMAPGSMSCMPANSGSICQAPLNVVPGTYTAAVTLYAAANASPLSAIGSAQTVAFTVLPNASNVVNLAVGTVPADLVLIPASAMSAQNTNGTLDLYGSGKHQLALEMLDAQQNVVVPTTPFNYTVTSGGGALPVTAAPANPSQPNLFTVSYVGAANAIGNATLRVGANPSGPGPNPCMQIGAVCSDTVTVDSKQLLAVANSSANTITLYVGTQNVPVATLSSGLMNPQALVFDANGDLFIASEPNSVIEYAPPYTGVPTTIAVGVNHPQALALDPRGDLFVANGNGSNTVTEYVAPYTGGPSATISTGIDDPVSLGFDSSANLYVANTAANSVTIYAPPYSGSPTTIGNGLNAPNSVALDAHGNVFVSNLNSTPNSVLEYTPPFTSSSIPVAWITNGIAEQGAIGVGGGANLFVPNQGANSVTEYSSPFTTPPTTIKGGQSQPIALAIDAIGNLFVANYGNNSVTVYPPPYAGVSWTTIANGVVNPQALALSPATSI